MQITVGFLGTFSLNRISAFVNRWSPIILVLLAILVILPGIGMGSLKDWDEAIYAQISKEIVQTGDWITLHHGYRPFFEKPPLLMWMTAIFYKLFGVKELWARMPSALSGILLVWVTYLSANTIFKDRTGILAGLILIGCHGFVFEARNGETDMLLSLFVFTGIFAYLRLRNGSSRWWYLVWVCCALAFMVKLWAGLVLPITLGIVLLIDNRLCEGLQSKHFWWGLLLAAAVVIPWHLLVYLRNDQAFVNIYFTRDLVTRTFTAMEGHYGLPTFYLDVLRQWFSPWYFLFPFALAFAIREILSGERKAGILIVQILVIFGMYTFVVHTKNPSYIFPIYPALSILTARLFTLAFSVPGLSTHISIITAALLATTIAQDKLLVLSISVGITLMVLLKMGLLPNKSLPQLTTSVVFVTFLLISFVGYILGNHRLRLQPIYGLQLSPVAQIARLAENEETARTDPLIGFAMEEDWDTYFAVEGPTAVFYSNRPVNVIYTRKELEELMSAQRSKEILIAEKYVSWLSEDFEVSVIGKVRPLVYARISH